MSCVGSIVSSVGACVVGICVDSSVDCWVPSGAGGTTSVVASAVGTCVSLGVGTSVDSPVASSVVSWVAS